MCLVECLAVKKCSEPERVHYHQGSAESRTQAGAAGKINKSRSAEKRVFKEVHKCYGLNMKHWGRLYYAVFRKLPLRKGKMLNRVEAFS